MIARLLLAVVALGAAPLVLARPVAAPLLLEGGPLGLDDVVAVAIDHRPVAVAPAARARVAAAFDAVLDAARADMPVYGLTTGVGWNKDRRALGGGGALDPELLEASRRFNLSTLRAHAAAVGEPLPDAVVRAAMLIRLNLMLTGTSGAQPAVVDQLAAFLNADIVPVVPARGSIGEADILQSSHIGLALAGEWRVRVHGAETTAADALATAGLAPVALVGKDFLAIIGDNSLAIGQAALVVHQARHWLVRETAVHALALEGLDGNVAPLLEATVAARPWPGYVATAAQLRTLLAGSDLWKPAAHRALQDPLSFRTMPIVLGNALDALVAAEQAIAFETAHGGDNPMVVLGAAAPAADSTTQAGRYRVPGAHTAAIVPSANFESLPLVAALERLALALAHVANSAAECTYRYENPAITGLPRFLTAPGNPGHGFGAVQKSVAALDAEIRSLALPVSLESATLAGNIEDVTNNGPLVVERLGRLVDLLYPLASLELLHAAQAVDLRPGYHLGTGTQRLHDAYRRQVPFVAQDRILTPDIDAGTRLLRGDADE